MHVVVLAEGGFLAEDEFREGVHGEADLFFGVLGDEGGDGAAAEGVEVGGKVVESDDAAGGVGMGLEPGDD